MWRDAKSLLDILERLWKIVEDEVPPLIAELERIVPPEEEV